VPAQRFQQAQASRHGRVHGSLLRYSNPKTSLAGHGLASGLNRIHLNTNGPSRGDMTMPICNVCMRRGIRSQGVRAHREWLTRRHLHHRESLRRHLVYILHQQLKALTLVIFCRRLRRVRLRLILIKEDAKSGHQPASITPSRAGIRRNKPWKLFQFPISIGKIIPVSSHSIQLHYLRTDASDFCRGTISSLAILF
jgi:hypothetical protein